MKILVVDDENDIRTILDYNLKLNGFNVKCAKGGEEALELNEAFLPTIVILDIMMDGIDGIELCKKLRKINPSIYILMLSASSDDYTKIKSYEAGCDDFVGKPIKMKLLVNKIKAIQSRLIKSPEIVEHTLNNYSNPASNSIIEINDIRIDLDSYIVHVGDKKCELPKKQFELLVMLAKKPNKVFTREKIYDQIWGDSVVGERTLDVHITRLRNRLGVNFIKSIKGVGYKIVDTSN